MKYCECRNIGKIGILIFAASLLIVSGASAATIAVKQDGSGDHTTIQAAIDASAEGDVIVISAGTYTEDVSVGDMNVPSIKKSNLTLKAADGEAVEIVAANTSMRFGGLDAAGFSPGPQDMFGFIVHGDNVVIEGLKIVQPNETPNALNVNLSLTINGADCIVRDCEIVGPGAEADGDIVGLVGAVLDVYGIQTGNLDLVNNLRVENCKFTDCPYAFALSDFLGTGVAPTATLVNCEFTGNQNGIEIDSGITDVLDCTFRDNQTGLHLSSGTTNVKNCIIENNTGHGMDIDDQEDFPTVTIEDCYIANNGTDAGQYGIYVDFGDVTVTNTVITKSSGPNVFFRGGGAGQAASKAIFDHCDLYASIEGVGMAVHEEPEDIISVTMTNCNIVDSDGIENISDFLADFTLTNCNVFVTGEVYIGEADTYTAENVLHIDPEYVDAENGDFTLKASSPVATAGVGGTFIGAKGIAANVSDWFLH